MPGTWFRSAGIRVAASLAPVGMVVLVLGASGGAAFADYQIPRIARLPAHDGVASDNLGESIDIDGVTVIAGAPDEDSGGSSSGAAYIFIHNGTRWAEQAKLTHSSSQANDRFGVAVAVSGNNAIVGADGDDGSGSNAGTAYAFVRSGASWSTGAALTPSDPLAGDRFGLSVAVSGDTAVVGAAHKNGDSSPGAVYVFTKSGSDWTQQQKLAASDGFAGDLFGASVAIDGDTILVGTPNDNDSGAASGSAYVFTRSAGVWTQRAKLTNASTLAGDEFGTDVALDGTTIAIGAPFHDDPWSDGGAIYVYSGSGASWSGPTKLSSPVGGWVGNGLGRSVDLDGGKIVAPKAASTQSFAWAGSGLSWTAYPPVNTGYGPGISVSGDVIASGWQGSTLGVVIHEFPAGSSPLTYWDGAVSLTFSSLVEPAYSDNDPALRATLRMESVNPAPVGYVVTEQTLYDLWTAASYAGTFTVGITYHDSNVPNWRNLDGPVAEADLKMLHWNGAAWEDITTSVDTVGNRVYGTASSMSEFVIVETGEATSNPYWDWDPAGGNAGSLGTPHKDYRLTTQKCAVCHAVHNANPNGELLLPTTRANACIYCHITTTLGGIVIYGGDPDAYLVEDDYGHQYDGGGGVACADCHSVHGANTIGGDQGLETKILRAGGYQTELVANASAGDEETITTGGTAGASDWGLHFWERDLQLTAFCTKCHQNYAHTSTETVSATGYRTHPMRIGFDGGSFVPPDYPDRFGLGVAYAWMPSSGCNDCHSAWYDNSLPARGAVGIHVQSFPHSNPGYSKLLRAVEEMEDVWTGIPAKDPSSDDVCSVCHIWDADEGTGRTY